MTQLKATRAKDREHMAATVCGILAGAQTTTLYIEPGYLGARCIGVHFKHVRGMHVTISFDGDDRQDRDGTFCMAWNISGEFDDEERWVQPIEKISDAFGIAMRANVNSYHRGKCTAFSNGFDDLCAQLRVAVSMLNSGAAYRTGSHA